MTFNGFAGLGSLHALRTPVFRSRTACLRRFQGWERDVRDESASVCLGGAGRQCIEAVLPLVRKPRLAPDQLTRVDTGFMSTFPQLSTSKKMHGLMRSRESVAQNDWSGDALQEALLNPLVFTGRHESRAPDTRIGCGRTNA